MRPTPKALFAFPLTLVFLAVACGDFADFDRRRAQHNTTDPDRRIIINQGNNNNGGGGGNPYQDSGVTPPTHDGGVTPPGQDSGATPPPPPPPQPDSGVAPPPTPDSGPTPPTGKCGMTQFEEEVFNIVNQNRQASGKQPYDCDAKAVQVARDYSALMCSTGHFSHYGPDGSSPWERLKAGGVTYKTAGENIAAGQKTPSSVMSSWMKSPGHHANIMSGKFTHIGVGYAYCNNGYKHYWTQAFFSP